MNIVAIMVGGVLLCTLFVCGVRNRFKPARTYSYTLLIPGQYVLFRTGQKLRYVNQDVSGRDVFLDESGTRYRHERHRTRDLLLEVL